jgi:hypothetical protein
VVMNSVAVTIHVCFRVWQQMAWQRGYDDDDDRDRGERLHGAGRDGAERWAQHVLFRHMRDKALQNNFFVATLRLARKSGTASDTHAAVVPLYSVGSRFLLSWPQTCPAASTLVTAVLKTEKRRTAALCTPATPRFQLLHRRLLSGGNARCRVTAPWPTNWLHCAIVFQTTCCPRHHLPVLPITDDEKCPSVLMMTQERGQHVVPLLAMQNRVQVVSVECTSVSSLQNAPPPENILTASQDKPRVQALQRQLNRRQICS